MNCVGGSCDDVRAIASTAASTVKAEYSTTVSGHNGLDAAVSIERSTVKAENSMTVSGLFVL